jgi:hypothetical protein
MNKILLTAIAALGLLAQSAFAQYTFSASPTTQTASGGTFSVTFSLQDTGNTVATNAAAFDLYIATAAANSGLFSITGVTGQGVWTSSGPNPLLFPDSLSTAGTAGNVRNNVDLGFSATSPQTGPFTQQIELINFSYTAGPGTYVFSSTTTANAGAFYSDVSNSNGDVVEGAPGTFTITIVPEPATWSLLGLGGLAAVGMSVLRRRRAS